MFCKLLHRIFFFKHFFAHWSLVERYVLNLKTIYVTFRSRSTSRGRHAATLQHALHSAKSNGRNCPGFSNSIQISSHHSKQRPPSPINHGRDEEKRRLHASRSHRNDEKVCNFLNHTIHTYKN